MLQFILPRDIEHIKSPMTEELRDINLEQPHQQPLPCIGADHITLTADAPRIGDSQLQVSSLWMCSSLFHDQVRLDCTIALMI